MKHDPNDPSQMGGMGGVDGVEGPWLSLSDIQRLQTLSDADLQALFPPMGFTAGLYSIE